MNIHSKQMIKNENTIRILNLILNDSMMNILILTFIFQSFVFVDSKH